MIEVPPKIWKPKIINQFKMPVYNDIDEGIFQFQSFGNCVYRTKKFWQGRIRDDLIQFNNAKDEKELVRGLHIGNAASSLDIDKIKNII